MGGAFYQGPSTGELFVALILGGLIGAAFSDKFRPYRKYLWGAIALIIFIASLEGHIPVLPDLMLFALGFYLAWKFLRVAVAGASLARFGNAKWADLAELRQAGMLGETGLMLGSRTEGDRRESIQYTGDRHLLTVAPTRSGKGVSTIIPNLLTAKNSFLTVDPKGENALITSRHRAEKLGQKVHVVDAWGITGLPSACFNPMDWLDPDDPDMGENASLLADALIVKGSGDQFFWDSEAAALLRGYILFVATDPAEQANRTLGRVYDLASWGGDRQNDLLTRMYASDNRTVSAVAERTMAKDAELRSNVMTSLQSHLHWLDSDRVRFTLSKSDFRFEDLKTTPMTVYLVIPVDKLGTYSLFLRLLIQQALTVNARNIEVQPERPVVFMLDEMQQLGNLSMVAQAYSLMAGFGMQLWGIVQDLSSMKEIYGERWQTFIANSGVVQYFGSSDLTSSEYFSKVCGTTTIVKTSFSRSVSRAIKGEGGSVSDSQSTDSVATPLVYSEDLARLKKGLSLLLIENLNPITAERIYWYNDPRLMNLGVNLKKRVVTGAAAGPVGAHSHNNSRVVTVQSV